MRKLILLTLLFMSKGVSAYKEEHFSIVAVGASNNTNSVFIDVDESASDTECTNKKHFKLHDENRQADRFYSTMLVAQAQSKQIVIGYESDECLHGGVVPRVFKILN